MESYKENNYFSYVHNPERGFSQQEIRFTDKKFKEYLCENYFDLYPQQFKKDIMSFSELFSHAMSEGFLTSSYYEDEAFPVEPYEQLKAFVSEIKDRMYTEAKAAYEGGGEIAFSDLATYLQHEDTIKLGLTLFTRHGSNVIAVKHLSAGVGKSMMGGTFLQINAEIYLRAEEGIVKSVYHFKIPEYGGLADKNKIGLLTPTPEERAAILARGTKYVELTTKPHYSQYKGNITRRSYWGDAVFRSDGRVMVDFPAMRKIDPQYNQYFSLHTGNNRDRNLYISVDELTEDQVLLMPPYVYGFSFASKQWGEMEIDNIGDIAFNDAAYDMLVLEDQKKEMIKALVEHNEPGRDLISGKGGGLIFLLNGTPGVGKTLTAEAVAEKLHKPLYTVGAGELGVSPVELEKNLRNILDTAKGWDAVLLIDEADIFLEARSNNDILRNAMVGIFLRMLEYYQGILFLTTNRADSIDEAFFSRISMSMHYEDLNADSREQIWGSILKLYDHELTATEVIQLASNNINGRQIKNSLRIANSLASYKGNKLTYEEVSKVITMLNDFKDAIAPVEDPRIA